MAGTRIRSLVLVAVVVLAFGATAATLDSGSFGESDREPTDPNIPEELPDLPTEEGGSSGLCPDALDEPTVFAGFVGAIVVAMLLGYRLLGSATLVAVVGVPLLLGGGACSSVIGGGPLASILTGASLPSSAVVVGIVLALCGALAFLFVLSDDRGGFEGDDAFDDEAVDLAEIGRAAGAAADHLEGQADITNEVYRAWYAMVRHLNVSNPQAATPDEFETRAVDAGMRRADVSELTRLFEDVRYGELDPDGREQRAIEALRRIERTYVDADVDVGLEAGEDEEEDDERGSDGEDR